ncbi:MAG: alcohol dehydrogenase catalytic domain-containing protein, partial [Candidatus Aminicenantes bacterium]|nr:alcohol dehydrogenase catalytic domain-containing protein [Candidatus Aminicenantes bacterium]
MKAMVLEKFAPIEEKPLVFKEISPPQPEDDEILVEVSVCGVCHTDLHTVEGDLPQVKLPIIPGHQVIGRVKELGPRASRFNPGDRVGIAWLYSTDETCEFCRQGLENLCPEACFTGYHVNGGY